MGVSRSFAAAEEKVYLHCSSGARYEGPEQAADAGLRAGRRKVEEELLLVADVHGSLVLRNDCCLRQWSVVTRLRRGLYKLSPSRGSNTQVFSSGIDRKMVLQRLQSRYLRQGANWKRAQQMRDDVV